MKEISNINKIQTLRRQKPSVFEQSSQKATLFELALPKGLVRFAVGEKATARGQAKQKQKSSVFERLVIFNFFYKLF